MSSLRTTLYCFWSMALRRSCAMFSALKLGSSIAAEGAAGSASTARATTMTGSPKRCSLRSAGRVPARSCATRSTTAQGRCRRCSVFRYLYRRYRGDHAGTTVDDPVGTTVDDPVGTTVDDPVGMGPTALGSELFARPAENSSHGPPSRFRSRKFANGDHLRAAWALAA